MLERTRSFQSSPQAGLTLGIKRSKFRAERIVSWFVTLRCLRSIYREMPEVSLEDNKEVRIRDSNLQRGATTAQVQKVGMRVQGNRRGPPTALGK